MSELRLSTADRGETAMVFALDKNQANGKQLLIHLEHVGDGSPGGSWVSEQMLESHISSIQFESSASGKPYLLYYDTGLEGELVNSQISDPMTSCELPLPLKSPTAISLPKCSAFWAPAIT